MNCFGARIFVPVALLIAAQTGFHLAAAEIIESDICVYGGTSGGVIAAVQAARMGKSVVVAEFGRHVGGLSSGGLGRTDTGNIGSIGGLSREFYQRAGRQYGQGTVFNFEPHVAEQAFLSMLNEVNVPVYYTQRLASVTKVGERITEITMENGNIFRAKMFIDTTYEGDLLAMAGVSFTVGRESTNTYGESLNGIRPNTPAHQFVVPVDPYVVPGDSNSGLLPFIQAGNGGAPGSGDQRVQAYNFRLCLTQVETNKIPIAPPPGYDPAQYELLGRYVQARVTAGHSLTLGSFLSIGALPNGKTDMNNNGAFSTDFIGMNYTYPTNTHAARAVMIQEHENYIRGFLTFLANDPRVPETVRTNMQSWGLAADEFQDTGGWPHSMYVREGRRMVSDYVMIQSNCAGTRVASDSIALASYNMDSHNCQRIVSSFGSVTNEGDVQLPPAGPFPISYRSIVPRVGECENLFATFALSGSHIAFSSCRMEPVFMMTSQSAATAAAFAIDDDAAVQDVPYAKLRLQLLADRQILEWGSSPVGGTNTTIVDNENPTGVTLVGSWVQSTGAPGYNGTNFLHDNNAGKGTKSVRFTPTLPQAGNYAVYLRWTANANRANNTPVTLTYSGGTSNYVINQQNNGGVWNLLGTFPFQSGTAGNILTENAGTTGFVIADAAMWVLQTPPVAPTVEVIASDAIAAEDGFNSARFTFVRSGDNSAALTVNYAISGTATGGVDYVQPSGSLLIPAGQSVIPLTLSPLADSLFEGDETIEITLLTNAGYTLGTYTNASAVLHDGGFGAWRGANFTAGELADPDVSGANADPEEDSIKNLLEFFHGSNPKASNVAPPLQLTQDVNGWHIDWQRHASAASLYLRLEASSDLVNWAPAPFPSQSPQITAVPPFESLRFTLGSSLPASYTFYRVAVSQQPLALTTNEAHFFFSFDTLTNGTGTFTDTLTASDGFFGTPTVERFATATDAADAGGALSFVDFTGTNWVGAGSSTVPGHSLTYNPGSVANQLSLTFSTIGLRNVRVRFDVRSATQGGTPPTNFTSFTYDIGGGPVSVPAANLNFVANNAFQVWSADLSAITVLENRPAVTLRWTFEDLGATPAESMRFDNLQVSASPVP